MDQGLLPRRYAKALYKFASDKGDTAEMYQMMQNLSDAFESTPGLRTAISNPFVEVKQKADLVVAAAQAQGDKADQITDLVKLLVKNNRIEILPQIALVYGQIYREENNIYKVQVESASPLNEQDKQRLTDAIEKKLNGAHAEMSFTVNPDLIGGFVVNIDNTRLDASILKEFSRLRQQLLS